VKTKNNEQFHLLSINISIRICITNRVIRNDCRGFNNLSYI